MTNSNDIVGTPITLDTVELESGKPYRFWAQYVIPVHRPYSYTYTVDAPPGVTYVLTPIHEHFAVTPAGVVDLGEDYNLYFDFTVTLGQGHLSAANPITLTFYESFDYGNFFLLGTVIRPFTVLPPLTISIEAIDAVREEKDDGTTEFSFRVTLSAAPVVPVTVDWAVTGSGLSPASSDDFAFGPILQTLSFGVGETTGIVTVKVGGDVHIESDEEFTVSLSNPSEGQIENGTATGTIIDDDPKLTVVLGEGGNELTIYEGQSSGSVTITLSKPVSTDIDVRIESVLPWEQDIQLLTTVRIPANQTSFTIPIASAFRDSEAEPNEQFLLKVSAVKAGSTTGLPVENNAIQLNVRDEALTDTPGQKALDVLGKVFLVRSVVSEAIKNIGNAPSGSEWEFFKTQLESKVLEKTLKVIDVGTAAAAFRLEYEGAQGNPAKQNLAGKKLFLQIVDAYVAAEVVGFGTAAVGAILAGSPPGLVFLSLVAVGGLATWGYSEYLSPIVKTYAGALWDEGGTYEAPRQLLHGPVAIALVYLDVDGDGELGPDELDTVSDGQGWFTLPFGPGTIASIGGTDTATGLPVELSLRAPGGSAVVSPLSTLAVALVAQGDTDALAFSELGLAAPTNLAEFNPIAAAMGGDAAAITRFAADGQVYASVLAISKALSAALGVGVSTAADAAFAVLANRIGTLQPGEAFDLTSVNDILEWIGGTENALGVGNLSPGGLQALATVVAGFNHLMAQGLSIQDPSLALATIIQAQKFAEETVVVAIQQMATGQLSPETFVDAYTGGNLEALVLPPPQASVAAVSAVGLEGASGSTAFTFIVTLSGDLSVAHDVFWMAEGSGTNPANGNDFAFRVLPLGTLRFAPGETSKMVVVNVTGDTAIEADETFSIVLSEPSLGLAILDGVATGTIQNDDSASVSIAAVSAAKAEENSGTIPFTFKVTLSQAALGTQTADWTVTGTGDHAADGTDFVGGVLPSGTVTFAAGETSQTITLPVAGDTIVEFDDFFLVTLSNPSPGLALGSASALGIAQNDDRAIISIAPLAASKAEGDSSTVAFTFTVKLDQASFAAQTADWSVTGSGGNAADAADFGGVLPSGTVSFAAGETNKVVTVLVSGDTAAEFNEEFAVTLSNLTFGLLLGTASATGTILNDDRSVVSVTAGPGSKAEGNGATKTFDWTVSLDRAGVTSQTVAWAVSGSSAHAADGADLAGGVLPSGTLTFAPGETTKTVTLEVAGDATVEFDEGLVLTLSAPSSGLDLGTAAMGGTILNDDLSAVSIAAQAASKAEGSGGTTAFTFTVTRNQAGVSSQTVDWNVTGTGANAADAADFGGALPAGTVTFAAGETSTVVTIQVSGDSVGESHETFLVSLSNPSSGLEFGTATASGTILDDDGSVSIAAQSAAKAEGGTGITTGFIFTVTTTGDASTTRSVAWAVTGAGAGKADAADFAGGTLPSGVLTFQAGETSKALTITVNGDATAEPDEGFAVSLSNPSSSLKIGTGSAGGTIQNDDSVPVTVTAHDDAYIVLEGQSLTIAAVTGVLFNDQSATSASLLANAGHGAVQLAAAGGFGYTPAAGFTGVDSFTYHAVPGGNGVDGKAVLYVVPVNTAGASTTLDLLGLTAAEQIAATYTAFFGRAADAGGHSFWVGEFIQHLPTQGAAALFANIASSFGISAEAKALYPFLASPFTATDAQISAFLESVYNNLFNRSSDAGGLAYWTGEIKATLQAGKFVGSVLVNIMSGAQDTAAGKDITTLMGKVAVSLEYVHEQQEHGTPWRGASDVAAATALLETVTADPSSVLVGIRDAETLVAAHA